MVRLTNLQRRPHVLTNPLNHAPNSLQHNVTVKRAHTLKSLYEWEVLQLNQERSTACLRQI